jgi:hypothetical protein
MANARFQASTILETCFGLFATPEDIHTVSRNASKMKSTKYPFHSFALGSRQLWAHEFAGVALSTAKQSTIVLPASILVPGIYHLRLDGVQEWTVGGLRDPVWSYFEPGGTMPFMRRYSTI